MHILFALIGTVVFAMLARRYAAFATKNFNTQAYVSPESVPAMRPNRDHETTALTLALTPPQAQIGTGFGEQISIARLNPSLPPDATFGNTFLDSPTHAYIPVRTG